MRTPGAAVREELAVWCLAVGFTAVLCLAPLLHKHYVAFTTSALTIKQMPEYLSKEKGNFVKICPARPSVVRVRTVRSSRGGKRGENCLGLRSNFLLFFEGYVKRWYQKLSVCPG